MKRLFAFVLVLTVILGTVVIPAWANTTEASTGSLYAIPNDATQVELDGEAYTVLRNLDDVKAAFPTTWVNMNRNYILAADIDCTGTAFVGKDILIPAGTVLEGNGFGFINVTEKDGFLNFQYGDEIVIRNTHFGTKSNPIVIRTDASGNFGVIANGPFANTRWENCQFYTGIYCQAGGYYGGVFGGKTSGTHTFIDCVIDSTVDAGGAAGDHGLLASRCSGGMATFILDGVDFYGYVSTGNNGAALVGWSAGDVYAENCNNYATIRGAHAGGFIGKCAPCNFTYSFKNCVNYGMVSLHPNTAPTSKTHIGGFVGEQKYPYATFEDCVNFGPISAGTYTGGFVGQAGNGFTAINCLNAGTITGGAEDTGGIAGGGTAILEGCVNIGKVFGGTNAGNMLGKVGNSAVTNGCYGLGSLAEGATGAIHAVGSSAAATGSGNKYLGSFDYDSYLGTTQDTDAITQEEALTVLEEQYPEYVFVAEDDGSISLNQTYLRAVQNTAAADGKFNVRILGTVSSLNQLKLGFQGTVSYTENGTPKTKDITIENSGTTRVHKAILAGESVVSAEDLMGSYIYTLKLENLPATGEITIKLAPVSVLAGETENTVIVGTTTTLIYQDGVFAGTEGDAGVGTVITLPAYTDEGGDTPVDPDANKEHPYDIPADATSYTIDGVEYKVIRTFADWEAALVGREVKVTVGVGLLQQTYTYIYPETLHLILADTLDGAGKTVAPEAWILGGGSVIEGNGYSIINYNGFDVFKIAPAVKEDNKTEVTDKVVVKNLDFGCEELSALGFVTALPEGHGSVGMMCASTKISTEWNNCNVYGKLFSTVGGHFGGWFGSVEGDHTFTDCSFNGFVAVPGNGAGFIGQITNAESVITFDGCENNADVSGTGTTAGFISVTAQVGTSGRITIRNSVNTGDGWGNGAAGGFIGSGKAHVLIENSENYGVMRAASRYGGTGAGGFIATVNNPGNGVQTTKIVNSVNYGTIIGAGTAAGGIIGIVGVAGQTYANPVELEKVANFGVIGSLLESGGIIGAHHATGLTVTEALNAGEVFGANASGIVGLIDKGTEINLEVCANVGKIEQVWHGSVSNIGGMASAMPDDTNTADKDESGKIAIKECYAFGELVAWGGSDTTGILVAIGSVVNEPEENSYADRSDFEVTEDMLIGIDNVEPYSLEDAVEILAEIYTGYTFTVVEDAIVVAPAQNG